MSLLNIDNPNKTLLSDTTTTTTTTKPSSEKIMTKRYCDLIKNIELPLRSIDIESNHLDVAALVELRHVFYFIYIDLAQYRRWCSSS
jgi:hypothetical protein